MQLQRAAPSLRPERRREDEERREPPGPSQPRQRRAAPPTCVVPCDGTGGGGPGAWHQMKSAVNPHSVATAPATTSMVTGRVNPVATSAPAHKPMYDADHARTGVSSHPTTTSR